MTARPREPEPSAALSGITPGVQGAGPWIGRRQLFARFAGEAETASLYTGTAFAAEVARVAGRSTYHALTLTGRDPLGEGVFLASAFLSAPPVLPILVETDGQRPEVLAGLRTIVRMVQVAPPALNGAMLERALETLGVAAQVGCEHALVLHVADGGADGSILRVVEQAHRASGGTQIVLHPAPGSATSARRWNELLERAVGLHPDTRLLPVL